MTELRTEPESSRTSSRRKNAVNGFKRASRRQAAVVGLAVLMGASFLGCQAGPRLFSRKDRDERTAKKELAEKDKNKFIHRKKVRPESDYRDDTDERVAKSNSKSKAKPTDAARKTSNDATDRAVASRQRPDDANHSPSRSTKGTVSQPKTSQPSDRAEIASRDAKKRPVTDLLDENSLFNDKLPETRATAKGTAATKPSANAMSAKSKVLDEDPFKNSVIGTPANKRPENKVATVNFFDEDDLDDEMDEEAEELDELRKQRAKTSVAKAEATASSLARQASTSALQGKQKFLDEPIETDDRSFRSLIREDVPKVSLDETIAPLDPKTVKRSAETVETVKTVAGQKVIDRRQQVQQTIEDWRREMERDESLVSSEKKVVDVPAPDASIRPQQQPVANGHISPASIEEFTSPMKSQGAVLNGELIIDTNSMPSRFQRTSENPAATNRSPGASGRVNSNSGASIDIVPGATQARPRSAEQISLQSASEGDEGTGLTTAGYEQTSEPAELGRLPSLKLDGDSETGPKLAALEDENSLAPAPPKELPESSAGIGLEESSARSRVWKRTLLVFGAMASAVMIGFGLRRRMELTPQPIRVPTQPQSNDPQDRASWPRG